MSNGNVILLGASRIREAVIEPFKRVDWHIAGAHTDVSVIYADTLSIFVFDFEQRLLHCVSGKNYVGHTITALRQEKSVLIVSVKLNTTKAVTGALRDERISWEVWERLKILTGRHPPTHERIASM